MHRIIYLLVAMCPMALLAGTINVSVTNDTLDQANGDCTLREAMLSHSQQTNIDACTGVTAGGPNIIDLADGATFVVNNGQLPNWGSDDGALELVGGGGASIDCQSTQIIDVDPNNTFTMRELTIDGCVGSGSAMVIRGQSGTTVNIVNSTFSNNGSTSGGEGGAIRFSGDSLALTNVNFLNNSVIDMADSNPDTADGRGGALYISGAGAVAITNTTFTNNVASDSGGAIYFNQGGSLDQPMVISNTVFTNNQALGGGELTDGGGAIFMSSDSDSIMLIAFTGFVGNSAPNGSGGALFLTLSSALAYSSADFVGNLDLADFLANPATLLGGSDPVAAIAAIVNNAGAGGIYASNFSGNSADGTDPTQGGGAIYSRGVMTINQSSFLSNSTAMNGGAYLVPGLNSSTNGNELVNVTMNGNTAGQNGGAISNGPLVQSAPGEFTLINVTIAGNSANGDGMSFDGGAIFNDNTTAADFTVINSILGDSSGTSVTNCAGDPITDLGNNLQFSPNDTSCGAGIVVADPVLDAPTIFGGPNIFVNVMPLTTDMTDALGAGDTTTCANAPVLAFDATGRPDIRPGPSNSICDIGAYEAAALSPVTLELFEVE